MGHLVAHDFMTDFQRTSSLRPSNASPREAICNRIRKARTKVIRDLATLSLETLHEPRRPMSSLPSQWANADLPACSNLCDLPGVCVDTGDCQCVLSSCPPKPQTPVSSKLERRSISLEWKNILRPDAARFITSGVPLPKIGVAPTGSENSFRRKLESGVVEECVSTGLTLEKGIAAIGTKPDEVDLPFVPSESGAVSLKFVFAKR